MGNGCAGELEKRFGLADEAVKLARPGFAALLLAVAWPWPALAYRPFDSTDAAVADKGVFEIELSPLSYRHDDEGAAWIAPSARLNYGFIKDWEIVLEGQAEHFSQTSRLTEAALSAKTVLQEGTLQDKPGISLGSEFSILLPGIHADDGAGLEWTGLASQREPWGIWHVNLGPMLTRDGRGGVIAGGILEGPQAWAVRPAAEIRYEKSFGGEELIAGLVGLIIPLHKGLALDVGLRHARRNGRPDKQMRAGITFDVN